jgi:hypothetical protein
MHDSWPQRCAAAGTRCGICGTDVSFLHMGGMPLGPGGQITAVPLGHEPAGEVAEVGADVTGLKLGDRVVLNPQAAPSGSYAVLLALARELPAAVVDANFYPTHGHALLQACQRPIEVFCHCPAAEVERRFTQRAPTRHPGHVDHVLDAQLKAALDDGVGPLGLGGPVMEVDTADPVDVAAVATWISQQPEWHTPELLSPARNPTRRH